MKDDQFIRDKVPMTKEGIRAISIDRLQLKAAKDFLDIGAGTGSISLQAAYEYPDLAVVALEHDDLAVNLIHKNIQHFQLDNITVIQGQAPWVEDLARPGTYDAIFVGGSGGYLTEIIQWSYELLQPGGRLVMNFILNENLMEAMSALEAGMWGDIDGMQVQVSKLTQLGTGRYFKPENPTFILSASKEMTGEERSCRK